MAGTTENTPVRTTPLPDIGPRFDGKELQYLTEAIESNNLLYLKKDGFVSRMLGRACEEFGAKHAVATSSGTAALHVAVAAAQVEAGAEVITSPITDMGTLIAILYQNAIPTFADVDPNTFNMTAASIEAAITEHTQAVIVIHLAGSPCDMDDIVDLCKARNLTLIEDCAQAFGCKYKGKHVGSIGDIGAFSFNNYKHLSAGDGGIVTMNDERLYQLAHNYADKYYDRLGQGNRLERLAPNYRMSELQGAVALAQFDRMTELTEKREALGRRLSQGLAGIDGVQPHGVLPDGFCSYWFYMCRIDPNILGMTNKEFAAKAKEQGIHLSSGYLERPIYQEPVFLNKRFFEGGVWPAEVVSGRTYDYSKVCCPVAEDVLNTAIRFGLHQGLSEADIDDVIEVFRRVAMG